MLGWMVKHNWTAQCAISPDRLTKQPDDDVGFPILRGHVWADRIYIYGRMPINSQPSFPFVAEFKRIRAESFFQHESGCFLYCPPLAQLFCVIFFGTTLSGPFSTLSEMLK